MPGHSALTFSSVQACQRCRGGTRLLSRCWHQMRRPAGNQATCCGIMYTPTAWATGERAKGWYILLVSKGGIGDQYRTRKCDQSDHLTDILQMQAIQGRAALPMWTACIVLWNSTLVVSDLTRLLQQTYCSSLCLADIWRI